MALLAMLGTASVLVPAASAADDAGPIERAELAQLDHPSEMALVEKEEGKKEGKGLSKTYGITIGYPNPYGCFGRSHWPHIGSESDPTVAGKAETYCDVAVDYQYVKAYIYRWRGWWWDRRASDSSSDVFTRDNKPTVEGRAARGCAGTSYRWKTKGYHKVKYDGGTTATGYTQVERPNKITCSY